LYKEPTQFLDRENGGGPLARLKINSRQPHHLVRAAVKSSNQTTWQPHDSYPLPRVVCGRFLTSAERPGRMPKNLGIQTAG